MPYLRCYPYERVRVICTKCERRGDYSRARLIAKYGPETAMTFLLSDMSRDCPKRNLAAIPLDWCGARFEEPCQRWERL